MRELLSFPNPVNEKAARVVAGVVLVMVVLILATTWYWVLIPLAYGFWARVLTGPKLSPVGWVAQNVIAPRLGPKKPVAGPPKRFAQSIGAVMSTAALVLALIVGDHAAADVVLLALVPAAGLESIFAYCLGCKIFGLLIRAGLVPETGRSLSRQGRRQDDAAARRRAPRSLVLGTRTSWLGVVSAVGGRVTPVGLGFLGVRDARERVIARGRSR